MWSQALIEAIASSDVGLGSSISSLPSPYGFLPPPFPAYATVIGPRVYIPPQKVIPNDGKGDSRPKHVSPKTMYPSSSLFPVLRRLTVHSRKRLQALQFPPNWMCMPKEISLQDTEVDGIVSQLRNIGKELLTGYDSQKMLAIFGVEPIINNIMLVFMMILQENYPLADNYLTESYRLIAIGSNSGCQASLDIIPVEYAEGLSYVVKGLQLLLEAQSTWVDQFNFEGFINNGIPSYVDLPRKAKTVVMAIKITFLKLIDNERDRSDLKIMSYDELVNMDPEYYAWKIRLYLHVRKQRHITQGVDSIPDETEIKIIQEAWNAEPSNLQCVVYMCYSLAEYLSNYAGNKAIGQKWKLTCGQLEFSSELETVTSIKEFLSKILAENSESIAIYLAVADILTSVLPWKYRDYVLGRECIFAAFRIGQMISSTANQYMASFLLRKMTFPFSDRSHPLKLLEKAVELNSRNGEALIQLFELCIARPMNYNHYIRKLFATHLTSNDLPPIVLKELMFLKGCYHLLIGEIESGIMSWVSIYASLKSRINFSRLRSYSYLFRIYDWPFHKISLSNVIYHTNNYHAALISPEMPSTSSSDKKAQADNIEVKNVVMQMLADQFQALNADDFYKHVNNMYGSQDVELIPLHHSLPFNSSPWPGYWDTTPLSQPEQEPDAWSVQLLKQLEDMFVTDNDATSDKSRENNEGEATQAEENDDSGSVYHLPSDLFDFD